MKNWIMFWSLGLIWGSSFLLIKVSVDDLGPLPLVSIRIGLAAAFMFVFLYLTGRTWPHDRREQAALIFVGVMNTAVPFTLITWGEQDIDSGLATVLNATVPLFTLVFAHFALADERMNLQKVIGLGVGFVGIVILASRNAGSGSANPILGQLAVLLASASYALCAIVIRRYLRQANPFSVAGYSLIVGALVIITLTLLVVQPLPRLGDVSFKAAGAVIVLALINTVLAYFLLYHLLDTWGATRTTLVTYVMPPIGVTLGAYFLDEVIDREIIIGTALILGGIVAVNWRKRQAVPVPAVTAPAETV